MGAASEVLALRRANHPFVVKLEHAFQTPKNFALLLEFCPADLNRRLCTVCDVSGRYVGLPAEQTAMYLGQILLAVVYLQEDLKIVYRDLKPENILISEQDQAKLADFGLAKTVSPSDRMTTCGTMGFIAPETNAVGDAICLQMFE